MRAVGDARLGHRPVPDRRGRGVHDMGLVAVVVVVVEVIGGGTGIDRRRQGA